VVNGFKCACELVGVRDAIRAETDPVAPLHSVDAPEIIRAFAIRIREPRLVLIGVRIPDVRAKETERGRIVCPTQKSDQLRYYGFERNLLRRDEREASLQVELQVRATDAPGRDPGPVLVTGSFIHHLAHQVEIVFHLL
jgi:hypothetical protein